jgi:predicted nucleotidyltransferase
VTDTVALDETEAVIAKLRPMGSGLRESGIKQLSLFGSVARGEAHAESDIELAVMFDPAARMDLIRLIGLERRLSETADDRCSSRPRRSRARSLVRVSSGIAAVSSKHDPKDTLRPKSPMLRSLLWNG